MDLDGTLVDSAPAITRALNQLLLRRGGAAVRTDDVRRWVSLGASQLVSNALGPAATSASTDVAEFRHIYGAQAVDLADLYPGAAETLARLVDAGARIGICTNKPHALAVGLVREMGLSVYIAQIVGGSESLRPKPHPDMLWLTLERMGAKRDDSIFVGDSEVDAATADAVGIPFVLVNFGYAIGDRRAIKCLAAVNRLCEIPKVLETLRKNGIGPANGSHDSAACANAAVFASGRPASDR